MKHLTFAALAMFITLFSPLISKEIKVIGYFPEWGIYERDYQVNEIPADQLTHVNYAFAKIKNGEIAAWDTYAALDKFFPETDKWEEKIKGNFKQLKLLKTKHPHLKVLISIGGWTGSARFSEVASTAKNRKRFVDSVLKFLQKYGFDGADIDWEYPVINGMQAGRPEDRENFTLLLNDLRNTLGDKYLLTAALSASPGFLNAIELKKVGDILDWINLMTYDFHGEWEASYGTTGHNSPLFDSGDPASPKFNIDAAVKHLIEVGIPRDKIVIGMPFYGRSASGVENFNNGLYASFKGPGPGAGMLDYHLIASHYLPNHCYTYLFDEEAGVPYLFDPSNRVFISFDDPTSIALKTKYAISEELGGVMFWELSGDNGDLIDSITNCRIHKN